MRKTNLTEGVKFEHIDFDSVIQDGEPRIFKSALNQCPLVIAGKDSDESAMSHLMAFDSRNPLLYYSAAASEKTRFFYNQAMNGFNYETGYASASDFFERLRRDLQESTKSAFYVGSAELEYHFPGLLESDGLMPSCEVFDTYQPLVGIWLGNRTTAATHYDVSNNIAFCAVGRRRFTLFPPDQACNLYPGPLEPTPGGQVVSMVDLQTPDFDRYPNFSVALEQAQVAELEAGDVLVYPAMWWHQVEALNDFNVLINYWWNTVPEFIDDPMNTLLHGLLSLRDRPDSEKRAWRSLFDYYVFGDAALPRQHLPHDVWGALGQLDGVSARRLRARLLKKLNR